MFPASLSGLLDSGFTIFFYVTVVFFLIYSAVLAYHWFSFGSSRSVSLTATLIYLSGGLVFISFMALSLWQM